MRDIIDPEVRPWRLAAAAFAAFGLAALGIALVGLYGVITFAVASRSTEIAIRVALGAGGRDVLAVVGGDALRAVSAGVAAGALVVLLVGRRVGPLLFQTSPYDARVLAGVATMLLVASLVASVVPTMRALRRSPAAVLRTT